MFQIIFNVHTDLIEYDNNVMSEQQNEEILNQQQLNTLLPSKRTKPIIGSRINTWTIYCKWRGKKSIKQQYTQDLEEVGTFNTVNNFLKYYSSIKQPSNFEEDTKIIYFLQNCKPFWEEWLHTGCLLITLKFKGQQKDKAGSKILNNLWEFLLFSAVGNNLPKPRIKKQYEKLGEENIIGLILSRRDKISVIQIWYRAQSNAIQLSRQIEQDIRTHFKSHTKEQKNVITSIKYKKHKDSIEANSTIKGAHSIKTVANKTF